MQNCSPGLGAADEGSVLGQLGDNRDLGEKQNSGSADLLSAAFPAAVALKIELKVFLFETSRT